eukprot:1154583-Pyramimonas_sp.AAC.1
MPLSHRHGTSSTPLTAFSSRCLDFWHSSISSLHLHSHMRCCQVSGASPQRGHVTSSISSPRSATRCLGQTPPVKHAKCAPTL